MVAKQAVVAELLKICIIKLRCVRNEPHFMSFKSSLYVLIYDYTMKKDLVENIFGGRCPLNTRTSLGKCVKARYS